MRFEIEVDASAQVRIIPTIESFPISRIEGRNGVGKTMAVRVLQLCSGEQPYLPHEIGLWDELRKRMGPVRVTCTDLVGADQIEWQVDPRRWPAEPLPTFRIVATDKDDEAICSHLTVDGVAASDEEVRRLIRVHRLIGDETLIESLTAEVAVLHSRAESERRSAKAATDAVRGRLDDLVSLVEPLRISALNASTTRVQEATETFSIATSNAEKAQRRRDEIRDLRVRYFQLQSLSDDATDPEERLKDLNGQLKDLHEQRVTLCSKRDALDLRAESDARTLADIAVLEAKADDHRAHRDEARHQFAAAVAEAGLAGLAPDDDTGVLASDADRAEAELEELRAAQARLDAGPQVIELGAAIQKLLMGKPYRQIADVPVAEPRAGLLLTPADLVDGVERRTAAVLAEEEPPQAEQLRLAVAQAAARVRALREAAGALRRYKRRLTLLRKLRADINALAKELSSTEGQKFAGLEREIDETIESEAKVQAERDELLRRIGQVGMGQSLADLRARLEREVKFAGIQPGGLDDAYQAATASVEEHQGQHAAAKKALEEATAAAAELSAARDSSFTAAVDPGAWWFELCQPLQEVDPDVTPESLNELANRLATGAEAISDRLDDLDVALDAARAGIVAAEEAREPDGSSAAAAAAAAVLHTIERRLGRSYFAQRTVAEALFGGGTFKRLDLVRRRLEWASDSGVDIGKPLAAFSSGERAFAYTRARLQRLRDESEVENRLVVLDEFGAFLERSRLDLLQRYLAEDVVGTFVDQALIILPLTDSPEALDADERLRGYRIAPLRHA